MVIHISISPYLNRAFLESFRVFSSCDAQRPTFRSQACLSFVKKTIEEEIGRREGQNSEDLIYSEKSVKLPITHGFEC